MRFSSQLDHLHRLPLSYLDIPEQEYILRLTIAIYWLLIMNNITRTAYLDSISTNDDNLSIRSKQEEKSSWYHVLLSKIDYIYMQFLLVTTLYVMEPWERCLVISIFLLVISLVTYSAFVYIPFHVHHIFQSTMPSLIDVFMH